MKGQPPRFLLPAALAWWGWQVDLLPWALGMGFLMELPRYVQSRWDLAAEDFRRLWNVTVLLFAGAGLYLLFADEGLGSPQELLESGAQRLAAMGQASRAGLKLLQWLPLLFFPFMLAHAWNRLERLPWSTVSGFIARWRHGPSTPLPPPQSARGFAPAYAYLVAVVFASSATDRNGDWFFWMLAGVVTWALWPQRGRRFSTAVWALSLTATLALAFAGQVGLVWTYRRLQQLEGSWLNRLGAEGFSPYGTATDIGAVGRRKQSGRIVLRVRSEAGEVPALLREAVFTRFQSPNWSNARREFTPVSPEPDLETWRFLTRAGLRRSVTVMRFTRRGGLTLALPDGTGELRHLPATEVETNYLTAARAGSLPALAIYEARFGGVQSVDPPPHAADLDLEHLRAADRQAVEQTAASLGLTALRDQGASRAAVQRVQDFFLRHFEYSLYQPEHTQRNGTNSSPIGHFLTNHRRGHCEYFATATVLLLRAAGIPARYVVGHSVQERRGDWFVVRGRHGHAWCLAHVDGRWETVDNTPGSWSEAEAQTAPYWEPFYDGLSSAWLAFAQWRQGDSPWRLYVFIFGISVLAYMGWRELRGGRWRRRQRANAKPPPPTRPPGSDSEFYGVLKRLEATHAPRPATTPVATWIRQLPLTHTPSLLQLQPLVELHYRLRFDPAGLSDHERERLRRGCAQTWE